jgi:nucleotide-binding universal stress UspA family protein
MSFKRILIAVDESAFAAHAADVGIDLAKSLKAETAFIHAIDPSVARAGADIGVPADKLMAMEERDSKNLLSLGIAREPALLLLNSLKSENPPPRSSRGRKAGPLTSS